MLSEIDGLDFLNYSKDSYQKKEENLEVSKVSHNFAKHIDQTSKAFEDSAEAYNLKETKNCNGYLDHVHLNKVIWELCNLNVVVKVITPFDEEIWIPAKNQ